MADTKISAYTELATLPAPEDQFVLVDDDDTTMGVSGTTKHVKFQNLIGGTLASNLSTAALALRSPTSSTGMTGVSVVTSTTGGFLAAATYHYVVTALDADGNEIAKSNEVSQATTGSTSRNNISWQPVPGAYSYRVYRGSGGAGSQNLYIKSFNDRGSFDYGIAARETAGTPPSSGSLFDNSLKRDGAGWFSGRRLQIIQDRSEAGERSANIFSQIRARGSGTVLDGHMGMWSRVEDQTAVANRTITNAVNNGSGLIRITATGHGFSDGEQVTIYGVGGTTEANNLWVIDLIDANTFDLLGSTFTNTYTSGGTATNAGLVYGHLITILPRVARGDWGAVNVNGDDMAGLVVNNLGTVKATEAIYVSGSGGATVAYGAGLTVDAPADDALRIGARTFDKGLDGSAATYTTAAIHTPSFFVGPTGNTSIGTGAAPSFTLGTKGLVLGDTAGAEVELKVTSNTAANGTATLILDGRASSAQIQGRIRATSAGDFVIGTVTNHNYLLTQNGNTKITLNTSGNIGIGDGVNFTVQTTTGTKFGTTTTGKMSWWNATPVAQSTGWSVSNVTTAKTFDCNNYTLDGMADTLGTLISWFLTNGLLGA